MSTDSDRYANEGRKYGLQVPFLRPDSLSGDSATAVDTMIHALQESEKILNLKFDVLLIIEPTSPLRTPLDVEETCKKLIESEADSAVCVSPLDTKCHPDKTLVVDSGILRNYSNKGVEITARQKLKTLYARNGICYALTKDCLLVNKKIITDKTTSVVIDRHIVNIDEPIDIKWAEFLMQRNLA